MSEIADVSDKAYEKAKELGLEVVLPDEYTLQLDLDVPFNGYSEEAYGQDFLTKVNAVYTNFGIEDITFTKSKSGRTHGFIRLTEPVTAVERILLQAALGSDGLREILSFKRVKRGDPTPTLLFEVPTKDTIGAKTEPVKTSVVVLDDSPF